MKKFILNTLAFSLAALSTGIALAKDDPSKFVKLSKQELVKDFLDPDSVKFRNIEIREVAGKKENFRVLCGEVNSKNSMGAYIGYKKFAVTPEKGSGSIVGFFKSGEVVESPEALNLQLMLREMSCGDENKLIKKFEN